MRHLATPVLVAIIAAVVTAAICQARPQTPGDVVIKARKITITDDDGKAVIELSADAAGGRVAVRSREGKDVVTIGQDHRGGYARFFQNDGRRAAAMYTYQVSAEKTGGMIENYDGDEKPAVSIGSGDDDPGPTSMGAPHAGGVVVIDWHGNLMRVDGPMVRDLRSMLDSRKAPPSP